MSGRRLRILAVADSDSYVKWGAHHVDRMPDHWDPELCVVRTPWQPSADQLAVAVAGTRWADAPPTPRGLDAVQGRIAQFRPDVVLAATRGPSVKVIVRTAFATGRRPVIVSGLPGISFPPTRKAVAYRSLADLVLVHSRRELDGYEALAERMRIPQRFALATMPFLERRPAAVPPEGPIVFAAQAKFPFNREERLALLAALAETARRRPGQRVVVKVRASSGEVQTHPERHDLRGLLAELDPPAPPNLVVEGGTMSVHLDTASALVTVSSTAVLEAIARGVPVLALTDWGVARSLVNTGFVDSGFQGTLDDLIAGRFAHPDPEWLDANWFHDAADADWARRAEDLVALREAGGLEARAQTRGVSGGRLRLAWDRRRALGRHDGTLLGVMALIVGTPALRVLVVWRRLRRLLRSRGVPVAGPAPTEDEPDDPGTGALRPAAAPPLV